MYVHGMHLVAEVLRAQKKKYTLYAHVHACTRLNQPLGPDLVVSNLVFPFTLSCRVEYGIEKIFEALLIGIP